MASWFTLVWTERFSLAAATAAHLNLVLEALALAVLIGVALGILATRSRRLEGPILAVANILQTVPSLALLGFLLILFGGTIGKPPALAALVVYALLPIIKNTVLGIRGLDRGVAEAAVGLGMTPWQRLYLVELPLAVPVLLGGVRVAAVAAVGMATIAAAIGARGLGTYIYRGVSLSDPRLILLGAIPAALLALACDAALGVVEATLDPTRPRRSIARAAMAWAAIATLVGVGLVDTVGQWRGSGTSQRTIVIGSKDGTEMILLGHMLADLVESRTDFKVDRRFNLGGTLVCYNAVRQGGLDAYVEYTGTALTTILKEPPAHDPKAVYERVRSICSQRDGVAVLSPLGFENTFAILMRRGQAEALGIKTISDLRRHQSTLRAGFGPEFMNREDGYPGLVQAYGLNFAIRPRELDRNLLYQAVARGTLDVAAGDSTDGRISSLDLVVLEDDRHFFPPYEAVPFVNEGTLRKYPELRGPLDALAGRLDADAMRRLNYAVDGAHGDPATVARQFLLGAGLLQK